MLAGMEQLRPVFEAACDFGLDPDEVWEAIARVASRYPPQTPVHKCRQEVIECSRSRSRHERGQTRGDGLARRGRWPECNRNCNPTADNGPIRNVTT
jgi:hypothetical protein